MPGKDSLAAAGVQQPGDRVLDCLALRGGAEPFAELAAGYGDGYAVAFLAQPGKLPGCTVCRRFALST